MTHKRILIAYGSRYNCTADISQKLAKFLEERFDLKVSLLNLRETATNSWPLLEREEYSGIIIGTGIRLTKWTKEVRLFLKVNKDRIQDLNITVGFFISCGYASDPKHYPIALRQFITDKMTSIGFKPNIYEAFGGIFDFATTSSLSSINKRILRWGSRDLEMKVDYNNRNDYRDWDRIYEFGNNFVTLLNAA